MGFAVEFLYSWLTTAALTVKVSASRGFDAIQVHNPPDTYFAIALPFKLLGKRFVFDHHDLAPEMFVSRFGKKDTVVVGAPRARVGDVPERRPCDSHERVHAPHRPHEGTQGRWFRNGRPQWAID